MTDETKPLPCPFCGGEATPLDSFGNTRCQKVARCAGGIYFISVAAWNRRPADPRQQVLASSSDATGRSSDAISTPEVTPEEAKGNSEGTEPAISSRQQGEGEALLREALIRCAQVIHELTGADEGPGLTEARRALANAKPTQEGM